MKEVLTCSLCGREWKREKKRGRKPSRCPLCVDRGRENVFSPESRKTKVSSIKGLPSLDEVREWISFACEKNGVSSLVENVAVEFSSALRVTAGKAHIQPSGFLIELSAPLFSRISKEEQRQVVIHEICHLIAYKKAGMSGWGHGSQWKTAMLKSGENPKRTHSFNTQGLRNRVRRHEAQCGTCKKIYLLSTKRKNKIHAYHCTSCGQVAGRIYLTGKVIEIN